MAAVNMEANIRVCLSRVPVGPAFPTNTDVCLQKHMITSREANQECLESCIETLNS